MRFKALIVAVVALAALAGCSKAKPDTPAAPAGAAAPAGGGTVDPCSLLTTAEATTVLGKTANAGAPHSSTGTKQCQWDSADGSVAILVYIGGQKARWQQTYDQSKSAFSAKFSDVPGLGEGAFSNGIDLHVLKGDNMYQIGVSGPFQDKVQRAITVAKEALARV
jgi:Protein of unknown function (DUF3558)